MPQYLVASIGALGGVVAVLADGSTAVAVVGLLGGLTLAPAAATVGGAESAALPLVAGVLVGIAAGAARRLARSLPAGQDVDPRVPLIAPRERLFGPRSVRVFGASLALVGAGWVSLDVGVAGAARAEGAVFAASYLWLVGAVRLLRARALEDLAVAAVAVGLSGAVGWLLEVGPRALPEAATLAALAPLAGAAAGWLAGRRRPDLGGGT